MDRTAAFTAIRSAPINDITSMDARTITHTVAIPGLTAPGGGPLTVKRTYVLDEIAEDWVSVVLDFEFGDPPVVYGNHPLAIGPLREILPDALPQDPFPQAQRVARDAVVSMLVQRKISGWVLMPALDHRTLEVKLTNAATKEEETAQFNTIREYFPFQADLWWDDAHNMIRVRPSREDKGERVVSIG